ncbi:MAG TPA: hypothetical protein ENI86_16685 [Acidimicrobiales bacterium]|nr:hypothetical protein [Acidimicrobiales bacterium]
MGPTARMPQVIEASHRRATRLGVDPSRPGVPWAGDPTADAVEITELIGPLLDHIGSQLHDSPIGVVVADSAGRLTHRSAGTGEILGAMDSCGVEVGYSLAEEDAGTTGVGTCLEIRRPAVVVGDDHFLEIFKPFTCVNAPIVDPISSEVRGTIGVMCPVEETNPLLLPMTTNLTSEISRILLDRATPAERYLLEQFVRVRTSAERPVLTVNAEVLIAGPAARRLISGVDHDELWEHVSAAVATGSPATTALDRGSLPPVGLRCRPLHRGAELQGAVVEVVPAVRPHRRRNRRRSLPGMVGTSDSWLAVVNEAHRSALAREPLLITGERGTGRFTLARTVARLGATPTVKIADCSSLPLEGTRRWLKALDRHLNSESTVVLRNINLLPDRVAAAAAALIEDLPTVGRVIATSSGAAVAPGDGSAILHDLLSVLRISIPPLRQRRSDIAVLARFILWGLGRTDLPRAVADVLARQPWPGNVRQLESVLRATVARAGTRPLDVTHLPDHIDQHATRFPLHGLQQQEADAIVEALRTTGGNKVRAAHLLGISRATLYRRIHAYGLDRS